MRLRSHQRTVVRMSPRGWADRPAVRRSHLSAVRRSGRPTRMRRLRRWLRTGVLLTAVSLMRLGTSARIHWPRVLLLAGAVVTVIGISLPSGAVVAPGLVILLVGVFSPSSRCPATESARRIDAALVYRR
jgi:hypothetical protein